MLKRKFLLAKRSSILLSLLLWHELQVFRQASKFAFPPPISSLVNVSISSYSLTHRFLKMLSSISVLKILSLPFVHKWLYIGTANIYLFLPVCLRIFVGNPSTLLFFFSKWHNVGRAFTCDPPLLDLQCWTVIFSLSGAIRVNENEMNIIVPVVVCHVILLAWKCNFFFLHYFLHFSYFFFSSLSHLNFLFYFIIIYFIYFLLLLFLLSIN